MFEEFLKEIKGYLPLTIISVDWSEPYFTITGDNWNFVSLTEWRICNTSKIVRGCYDNDIQKFISNLLNQKIVEVTPQSGMPFIDPTFILSNNLRIQFFSSSILEPWKIKLPNGKLYIASPSDEKWGVDLLI